MTNEIPLIHVVIHPTHLTGAVVVEVLPPMNPGHDAPDDTTLVLELFGSPPPPRDDRPTVGNLDAHTVLLTPGQLSRLRAAIAASPERCIDTLDTLDFCLRAAGVDVCT